MKILTATSFVALLVLSSGAGQTAHGQVAVAPQPDPAVKAEMMKGCQHHHADVTVRLDQLATTLAEARSAGDITSIHAAIERSQSSLAAVRAAIVKCSAMMSGMHSAVAAPAPPSAPPAGPPAPPAEHKH